MVEQVFRLALLAAACGTSLSAQGPRPMIPDTSGIPLFWRIHHQLARDVEPDAELWDSLWATPGYAILEQRERRRAVITRAMELAYMPSLGQSRDSALRAGGWMGWVLRHMTRVPALRDAGRSLTVEVVSAQFLSEAIRLAQAFLPPVTTQRLPPPCISFLIFDSVRGYDTLLLDPLYLLELQSPVAAVGHELHHNYRNRIARPQRPYRGNLLMWRITTTETEGVASLIDMNQVPRMSAEELSAAYRAPRLQEYYRTYQIEYARSNQWLAWVDRLLQRADVAPDSAAAIGREMDAGLPDMGRMLGAFMASTIDEQLGRAALLDVVGDPFAFWLLYNDAARASGGQALVLSEAAIRAIERLRARYLLPGGVKEARTTRLGLSRAFPRGLGGSQHCVVSRISTNVTRSGTRGTTAVITG